jgi:hypothetical protein
MKTLIHQRKRLPALVVIVLILIAAGDAEPRSLKAKAALRKFDRAVERAEAARDEAVAAAASTLATELDEALKAAMKAGSLEEANAIKSAKESRAKNKPRGMAAPTLEGRWRVVYGNGTRRRYAFHGERFEWFEGEQTRPGALTRDDGAFLIDTGDGKLERWTPAAGRCFIEHFNPKATFPDRDADEFGVATREK